MMYLYVIFVLQKRGCRIIVVSKKVLALRKRAYVWLGDVGLGVEANTRVRRWGCWRGFGVVGCHA